MKSILPLLLFLNIFPIYGQTTTVEYWLQARMNGVYELENGSSVQFWGYGDNTPPNPGNKVFLPGPQLRFKVGDSAVVHFKNNSPEMHTIHFHGLDVNQANDGVGHTSQDIAPNQTFDYRFKCTNEGTFLYHCHVLTTLHLAMGMYGTVVVDPSNGSTSLSTGLPNYDSEYLLLSSEFDLDWNTNPISPGPFHLFEANYSMINGLSGTQLQNGDHDILGNVNSFIAIRLANIGYGRTKFDFPANLTVVAYLSDGRLLPSPIQASSFELYPGERFDLLVSSAQIIDDFVAVSYYDLRNDNQTGSNFVPIKIGNNALTSIDANGLQFWPNPVRGVLYCSNPSNESVFFQVYALDGKLIQEGNIQPGLNTLQLELLPGMYMMKTPQSLLKFIFD